MSHTYNTRAKKDSLMEKLGPAASTRSKLNIKESYKRDESSDDDVSDEDMSDDEYMETDDENISIDEDMSCDEEDRSGDEDDLLSEDDDDFIVKDKKRSGINQEDFQSLLAEIFPSKYMRDRVGANKKRTFNREGAPEPRDILTGPNSIRIGKKNKSFVEEAPISPGKMSNFNIIFTVNPMDHKNMDEYEDYYSSDDSEYDPERDEYNDEIDEEDTNEMDTDDDELDAVDEDMCQCECADDMNLDTNTYLDETEPPTKNMRFRNKKEERKKTIENQRRNASKLYKKRKYKNTLKFRDLLQQKNVMNDLNYFQEKMSLEEQAIVLQQMEDIKSIIDIEKPYRLALLEANIPSRFKASAYNKLSSLKNMEPGCSEYNKIRHWVDDFMRIPFNKINHLPVRIEDGVEKCHDFMEQAKNTLDKAVYGLNDVKLQVMQMVGQWITNPDAIGNSVAIEGPPGTGKTTLVKEGISKILNREFVFIPLGGATDSSCLEGHSYTYEGSNCGLIVKQLIQCQSMNPIIYFDELDKISDTPKGDEIVGILTHLTDTSQNSKFHDKYFAEFDFDLSRCVFFFSYNDRSKVNKILLDRMHCIMTKGYELPQKTIIATDYLLPTIREQVRFKLEEILLPTETIEHIINTHTHKEDGVRNLKRCLEIIHTKLNLYRLMKPGTNLFESDMSIKVEFPITITPQIVDKLIKKSSESGSWQNMYS
uniref:ATPase AAA-type core domain-containing protein n=1 Tax=viral metagenome TaxID=1070528 RepID=A0A6C0IJQ6_9ZZZZ